MRAPADGRGSPGTRSLLDPCTSGRAALLVLVLALVSAPSPSAAQQEASSGDSPSRYTVALRDVRLSRALQRFAELTDADIAYSTSVVEGRRAFCRTEQATAEELLRCVISGTGLDYLQTSGGTYVIVESVEQPPARGRLAGRVVDASTGEPVPSAYVTLADQSAGTVTDAAGQFSFGGVLPGNHRVAVTNIGYATAVDSVRIPPDAREVVRIEVPPRAIAAEPIIVNGLTRRLPSASLGSSTTGVRELSRLSGSGTPEVLRSAARRPGVSRRGPLADVHVQGGGDGEQVTLLDGVPVREPVSLGRLLSAFSPEAIERVAVHKTGFGVRHGSYTSGVVEVTHDLSRPDTKVASVTGDLLTANGRVETSWGPGRSGTGQAMIAARTSVWNAYRDPGMEELLSTWTQVDPNLAAGWIDPAADGGSVRGRRQTYHIDFSDVHGAVRQELAPFHHLYVSGYRGSNRFGSNVASVVDPGGTERAVLTQDLYDWDNSALQARYEWLAGARITGTFQLHGSVHEASSLFAFRDSSLASGGDPARPFVPEPRPVVQNATNHADEGNSIDEWGGRASVTAGLSSGFRLRAALEPRWREGSVHLQNRYLGSLEQSTGGWELGSRLSAEISPGAGTTVTAGTRFTHLPAGDETYAEPRLAVRLDRPSTGLGDVALRVAGGVHRQYVMQSEVSSAGPTAVVPSVQFWMPLDGSIDPPLAYHAAGEVLVAPSKRWTMRLEAYSRWQPRTLELDYAELVREPRDPDDGVGPTLSPERQIQVSAVGEARARGVSLRVERQGPAVTASVTGEMNDAERLYPGRFEGRFVPAPWEEPYRLTTDVTLSLFDGVRATGSWRGIWGRSWALRRAYYDLVALSEKGAMIEAFDLERPGEQELGTYSRLDLGIEGTTELGGVGVELRLNAINVLDRQNQFDWALDTSGPAAESVPRTLPGRRLSLLVGLTY